MPKQRNDSQQREVRSFLMAREPSIDRRFRPCPDRQVRLFDGIEEEEDISVPIVYGEDVDLDSAVETFEEGSDYNYNADTENTKSSTAASVVEDGALVYLRLRPVADPVETYSVAGDVLVVQPSSESASSSTNKNTMVKEFSFTNVFDSIVSQKQIYDKCINDRIELEDSFTVLTYGTSGSGKTFTLLGDEDQSPGIIPRAIEHIFTLYGNNIYPHPSVKLVNGQMTILEDKVLAKEESVRRQILGACPDFTNQYDRQHRSIINDHDFKPKKLDISVLIWVSFVEIYNELVYDLLARPPTSNNNQPTNMAPPTRHNLKVVGNDGKVFIKSLTSVYCKSSLDALKLLRHGLDRVTYASTAVNSNSSRSHCVFIIDVLKFYPEGELTETSYKFCDLAGSERLDKTGNVGSRLKEAKRINTSLMILGRCLDAANTNALKKKPTEIIPFRESKLTMILQAPLLGKEKLAMIVNVTPTEKYYEENMNVLNFASIAKNIIYKKPEIKTNKSRYSFFMANETKPPNNEYCEQLLGETIFLRSEIDRMNSENEELKWLHSQELQKLEQEIRNKLVQSFRETFEDNKKITEARIKREVESNSRMYELKIDSIKSKYEEQIEDLKEELEDLKEEKENVKKRRTMS